MAKFVISREDAKTPTRGGGNELFPAGVWRGQLEAVRAVRATKEPPAGPHFMLSEGAVEGEVASIQIGEITPAVEGLPDVGARKFFDDGLLLEEVYPDGAVVRWDEQEAAEEGANWRFDATRRRITNLALAIGAVEEVDGGVGPVEQIEDVLRATDGSGGLSHTDVIFEVKHRTYKVKNGPEKGTKKTVHYIEAYMPVV